MPRTRHFDYDAIAAAYGNSLGKSRSAKVRDVCSQFSCSDGTVLRAVNGRVTSKSPGGPAKLGDSHRATVLAVGHPATIEARTIFPTMVMDVSEEWLLKSADHNAKIGAEILKGPWKGFPVYTLTLEERATCPTSCRHWSSCYGNNSHWAKRWRHGSDLEWRLAREVPALELKHRAGFVVRLHNLGDFYSVGYVRLWADLLDRHPALHVFGYTARINSADDEIAHDLALLVRRRWDRFAVRFSNAPINRCSTISIESPVQKPSDAVICPAQWTESGKKTESCSTCGLCWGTTRRIAFLQH